MKVSAEYAPGAPPIARLWLWGVIRATRELLLVPKERLTPASPTSTLKFMQVSLKYAQEHLGDLVSAANRGEEVEIAAPNQSLVRLTLVMSNEPKPDLPRPTRPLGRLKGLIQVPTDEKWAAMDRELEQLMVHAPLTTDGDI